MPTAMPTSHHHRRSLPTTSFAAVAAAAFLFLSSVAGAYPRPNPSSPGQFNFAYEGIGEAAAVAERAPARRLMVGPGSWPPTCRSKCGWCAPCQPVHVPVQPGFSMPLEYYPEAWRCKCGDKLFMP